MTVDIPGVLAAQRRERACIRNEKKATGCCRFAHVPFDALMWGTSPHEDATEPDEGNTWISY